MDSVAYAAKKGSSVRMTHSISSLPPTETLLAFQAARNGGSFAQAARALNVNHATVLRRVQTLEAWLGTRVFERSGRGVVLTPAGQRFSADLDQAVETLERSADRWKPATGPTLIRLSVLPSFARLWLMPRLPDLIGKPQRYRIELSLSHQPVALGDGQTDVAIRYGKGDWDGLTAIPLRRETLCPVASARLSGAAEKMTPQAIAALPLIHDSDTSLWQHWFAQHGIRYRMKASDMRFEDYDLALEAMRRGIGALLRREHNEEQVCEPDVLRLNESSAENPRRHFVVVSAHEQRVSVQRFVECVCAHDV
ncbi:LysR substrate-binding domain-containing protein [Puniceibacterium sp. IMCC21224]|uniref:LysR substrate-binding domain-containing protein n=1 Tax=Puniceibacterium sp. IMCC21224 TaxID=1618204 RepID=UPI00065D621E|nr:LysR substrate-binding domain-containing protein [Puniceibacterium sp. IMCC21224]KMK64468.1 transcriptional regulator [Puniceibacterium sp. IMCC21224]